MYESKRWLIDVFLDEDEDHTRAEAVLHTKGTELRGVGKARRNPTDRPVPEIGEELAVARALEKLADRLMSAAEGDIEAEMATARRR